MSLGAKGDGERAAGVRRTDSEKKRAQSKRITTMQRDKSASSRSSSPTASKPGTPIPPPQLTPFEESLTETERDEMEVYFDKILSKTDLTRKDLLEQFQQFREDCPLGYLTPENFISLSAEVLGPDTEAVAETLFKIFDEDKNNKMDFGEYMMAMHSTKMETPEDKLTWIFNMYDRNLSGTIETEELSNMFRTLFDMSGLKVSDVQIEMLTSDMMQQLDLDGNGVLDKTEFLEGSLGTPFLMQLLCPDMA